MAMELVPPSDDILKRICKDINLDMELLERDKSTLRTWLESQPHLPHDLEDNILGSFIVGSKNSLERAKQLLDKYLTNRSSCPDFYEHRDPCDPALLKMSRILRCTLLPQMSPEGYRVFLFSMVSSDVTPQDVSLTLNAIKVLCCYDVRFLEEQFCAGDILIIDYEKIPVKVAAALMNLPVLKRYIHCVTNSLPVRFKKIIFINMFPAFEFVLTMLKQVIRQKLAQRIIATAEDHTYLYNIVPKDILPQEYGGQAGTIEELNDAWQLKVESYRDWFLKDMKRKVDESLRPEKSKYKPEKEAFGIEGSFKSLNVD